MWYGENLDEHMVNRAGDYVYIPANMPHRPYNRSETEPVVAIIARTDPNEQESVVLLPDLDTHKPGLQHESFDILFLPLSLLRTGTFSA